jgi:hypothetical protein
MEQLSEVTKQQKELQKRILEDQKNKEKVEAEKKLSELIEEEEYQKKLTKGIRKCCFYY